MRRNRYIFLTLLLGIGILLSGCSSSSKTAINVEAAATENLKEEITLDSQEVESMNDESGIKFDTTSNLNRKVIKTGSINLQTKTFEQTVQQVMDEVNKIQGFIQNCYIEGNDLYDTDSRRSAQLSVRIPNTQFDVFMNESSKFGNVTSKSIQGEDVTDQYMDTEIRLETLEIQAERLKELLKQAGDLDELFQIEKELASVTYEIEVLKGTLKKYDSLIDYSTIEIYIEEADTYVQPVNEQNFITRIQNTFMESLGSLIKILEGICLMVVGSIPFLVVFVPIIVIIVKGIGIRRKKKHMGDE